MASLNKVFLMGNLGRDPEVKTLESGAKVAQFSIATNEYYKDKAGNLVTKTTWHNIVGWRIIADKAEKLKKGASVYIEGKLTSREYTDANNVKRTIFEIEANQIQSLDRKEQSGNNVQTPPVDAIPAPEAVNDVEDDLPF